MKDLTNASLRLLFHRTYSCMRNGCQLTFYCSTCFDIFIEACLVWDSHKDAWQAHQLQAQVWGLKAVNNPCHSHTSLCVATHVGSRVCTLACSSPLVSYDVMCNPQHSCSADTCIITSALHALLLRSDSPSYICILSMIECFPTSLQRLAIFSANISQSNSK